MALREGVTVTLENKPFVIMQQEDQQLNAVVTPLRKAASYEQRKTNLGNQNFWRRILT